MENKRNWRKMRFARNLNKIIKDSGLDRKTLAAKINVPYPWLQRATTKGITRLDRRGREHLDKIATNFGISDADGLWDRDFEAPSPSSAEARATHVAEQLRQLALALDENEKPLKTILRHLGEANSLLNYAAARATHIAAELRQLALALDENEEPLKTVLRLMDEGQ